MWGSKPTTGASVPLSEWLNMSDRVKKLNKRLDRIDELEDMIYELDREIDALSEYLNVDFEDGVRVIAKKGKE